MNRLLRTLLVCFLFHNLYGLFPLRAEIRLPAIIDSGMVLRQNAFVPVWEKATPSEEVTITTEWSIQKYRTRADSEGNWQVKIRTASAGGPYTICFEGENRIELSDILLGEVWLASGQSNMEWSMQKAKDAEVEIAQADHPQIRLFKVNHIIADTPQEDFPAGKAQWKLCTPENVPPFSCMAYYFATNLQRELQVPVGIIDASWGGTSVDSWTSNIYMQEVPELSGVYDRWKEWERDTTTSASRYMHARPHRRPGVLFNGMIHPVIPFAISGCIWYQGSSNKEWSGEYFDQLRTLLRCWRSEWDQGDFPFLIQQLCVYQSTGESGEDKSVIREHQLNMQQFNKVYVGSALDLGDLKDIHPTDKREFGRRFANMALNKVYGKTEIPAFGPQYRDHKRVRNAIRITFDPYRSLHHTGTRINHLYIAGDDKIFYEASYRIGKNRLVGWSQEVKKPVTVRYMWNSVGFGNLFNEAGLPASAFRLDNWERVPRSDYHALPSPIQPGNGLPDYFEKARNDKESKEIVLICRDSVQEVARDTDLVIIRLENPPKRNDPETMGREIENQIRYIKEQNPLTDICLVKIGRRTETALRVLTQLGDHYGIPVIDASDQKCPEEFIQKMIESMSAMRSQKTYSTKFSPLFAERE